jgi:predicted nucleic acid-binding protein
LALTYLVDTSVLTRLREPAVRDAIEPDLREGNLARASISDLEIGYSARNAAEWDRLMSALDVFEPIPTSTEHLVRARQVQRLLAKKHQRGRKIPDLLVAAAAEANDLTVLHYDADFDRIAAVTRQSCKWIVRPGSID